MKVLYPRAAIYQPKYSYQFSNINIKTMKIKSIIPIVALATVSMTSVAQNPQSQQLRSGLDMSNMDNSVKPQDDFFHYACGGWMKKNPLPAAYSRYGSFDVLGDYFITLDNEFHKRLYTYAGYDRIWQAMHNVTTHMDRVRYLDTALCQMDMETFRVEHEQLYKYLMVGLPKDVDVDEFFEHHLGAYREHFQSLLDRFPDFFV